MPTPTISVVIATHNRGSYITGALDGLASQTLARELFEVIVVDNMSTDDTRERVSSHALVKRITYVVEPILGVSAARNTGWQKARGKYVAFLDDDAVPAATWLERMIDAFDNVRPAPSCVGGRVEPIFEAPPPSWISGPLLDYLTVIDHSPHAKFLTEIKHRQKLASANMAVTRAGLERVGGFSTSLDRVGTNLLSGGDVLVQLQLERLGLHVYYEPAVAVRHHVAAKRLTRDWLIERAYWGGVSDVLLSFLDRGGTLWWAMRTLTWGARVTIFSPTRMTALLDRHDGSMIQRCDAWHRVGSLVGGVHAIGLAVRARR